MATQALYRKWRSQTFNEVIGQKHITQTLQNAIEGNRVGHAYLFTGPRGTGKTSTARILAKAVNCTDPERKPCNACNICMAVNEGRLMDLIEIDAASNTSVDDIRDLRDKVDFRPGEASMKFYIIDEVHMLSKSAFNALLKTLEEPPPHVIFVLATTEPEKIPATITSRCQRFDFRRINVEEVAAWLRHIIEAENLAAKDDALTLIARQGGGSMRDSISLLDQLTTYGDEILTLELVQSVLGAADSSATKTLVDHMLKGDVSHGLRIINEVIQDGIDPRQFTLQIVEYLRGLLLVKYDNGQEFLNLPVETLNAMRLQAGAVTAPRLLALIDRFNQGVQAFKQGAGEVAIPQLPLELAFVEVTTFGQVAQSTPQAVKEAPAMQVEAKPVSPVVKESPPAPPSPQPSPPPPPTVSDDNSLELSLAEVHSKWAAVGAELKQQNKGMVQGLLNSGQMMGVKGENIVLSFPSELLKTRIEKHKPVILEAIDKVFGKPLNVEFVVGEMLPVNQGQQLPMQPSPSENDTIIAEKKTIYEDDPLIKSALELGGEIKGTRPIS